MDDVGRFVRALLGHWTSLVTGSAVIGVLLIAQGTGRITPPAWVYVVLGLGAVVAAAFRAWREEHRRAESLVKDRDDLQAVVKKTPITDVPNDLLWLLTVCRHHRIRRDLHHDTTLKLTSISTWIGDTPIRRRDSDWFYELVEEAKKRELLKLDTPTAGGIAEFRLPRDSEMILDVERARGRPVVEPLGALHDARTGALVKIPLPD